MAINSSPSVLVSRNINCANVTKDDFVNAIVEDMKNAYQKHIAHNQPIVDKRNEEYVNSQINKITEFANSKYKREKYKQEYINKEISKIKRNYFSIPSFDFVDFDVMPDRMGISYDCIISMDRLDKVDKCYDRVKDNEYFKKIIGWEIIYVPSSRNYFKFITDAETEKEMNARVAAHNRSVYDFYKDSTYWGD